ASLAIPVSDYILRIAQNHAATDRAHQSTRLTEQAEGLKVAAEARLLYYSWARAALRVVVAEQSVVQARGHLADARHGFAAGTLPRADVLRLESQLAASELVAERAIDLEKQLAQQLRIVMHDPSATRYQIGEDLRADLQPLPHAHALDPLVDEGLDRRLEL